MKKISYFMLLFVACVFASCAVGTYVPHSVTLLGSQTTVVLDKANYRVVRNVEAVVEVDNDRLRRADVEKSAFAELMCKYPLIGSQAYINVVCEEVQREKVFAFHYGRYAVKQYVAVRATIIEFLQDNGEPIKSVDSPYNTASQRAVKSEKPAAGVSDTKQKQPQIEGNSYTSKRYTEPIQVSKEMLTLAKKRENKFYIAYLLKAEKLDEDESLYRCFDRKEISALAHDWSTKDLLKKSQGHDKVFEQYAQ